MLQVSSNGKATTEKKVFSRATAISVDVKADKSIIWTLLTNASDYPRWNSTVISIDGDIKLGNKIQLKSTLDPKRVFKLGVKEFDVENQLSWGDAMGKRSYTLKSLGNGITNFTMYEKIGGPLFPLFAGMIPSFDESFEKFAADLKKEAEVIAKTN